MILKENEVQERLSSPLNLLNRLREATRSNTGKAILPFSPPSKTPAGIRHPAIPPSVDEIVNDAQSKMKLSLAHGQALEILTESMAALRERLPEVEKAEKLAAIAHDMNRIVNNIDNTRKNKFGDDNRVQIVVYAPQMMAEHEFEAITVSE